jgi:flavin-dependent dehydrogenase
LLTRRAARLSAERVLAVGDAVGYVEPFTGEGMAWALVSGALAGPLAAEACGRTWEEELADRWARLYHHHIGRRQRLCRVTAGVLRRPRLVGAAIRMLRHVPALAGPVTWALNRP